MALASHDFNDADTRVGPETQAATSSSRDVAAARSWRRTVHRWGHRALRSYAVRTASLRPLPDFLLVGTKRGGTTSMWNLLLDHPLVLPLFPRAAKIKSPAYFYAHYSKGPSWYRSHFVGRPYRGAVGARHGQRPVSGDASPYYLFDPRVAARAFQLAPQAKVIFMLRNPVDRAYSHYRERVRAGVEPLSFEEALAAEPMRVGGELERMLESPDYYSTAHDFYSYRERGVYLPQLERWLGHFPPRQVLITRSEDFYADQQAVYDRVTHFLGLPPHVLHCVRRYNYHPGSPMEESTRAELTDYFRPHNEALHRRFGLDLGSTPSDGTTP